MTNCPMLPPPGSPGSHSPAQAAPMASKEMEVGCRQDGDGKGNTQSASIKLSRALQSPAMEKSHRELTAAAVGQGKTSCFNTSAGLQSLDELFGGKGGHPAFASDGVSHISLLHLAACV